MSTTDKMAGSAGIEGEPVGKRMRHERAGIGQLQEGSALCCLHVAWSSRDKLGTIENKGFLLPPLGNMKMPANQGGLSHFLECFLGAISGWGTRIRT
jgi:hypothetical protein